MAFGINIPVGFKLNNAGLHKAKKEFQGFGKSLKGALGGIGIAVGLSSIVSFAVDSAKGFEHAQIASKKLKNVLTSMGVGSATSRVDAYAESLQNVVAIDADVIKATQTKLATFANLNKTIGKTGGAFDRATMAALDMAAAGFGTAEGNAVQLGKALQDPIKGLASLSKSGITFTDAEKKKISTLTKSGQILKAQDFVLKAIEKQVQGTAKAGASSFDKMKFSFDSIKDALGAGLLPLFEQLSTWLASYAPKISQWVSDIFDPTTDIGKTFSDIKNAVGQTFNAVRDFFALFGNGDAMKGFGELVKKLVQSLPALLALKSIMVLASAGKTIANLVAAMTAIAGGKRGDNLPTVVGGGKGKMTGRAPIPMAGIVGEALAVLSLSGDTQQGRAIPGNRKGFFNTPSGHPTNITVNAYGSTPAEFGNLIAEAINRHNRVNGKK
jgi:ribosomal protein L12E/L44/L45/RPP1/RPP2